MQEKRNKILAVSLVVITSVTIAALFVFQNRDSSPLVDKNIFNPESLSEVDHITLKSDGQIVDLRYSGKGWIVNERYSADDNMIDVLFATLEQAQPKRPVAASLKDSLSQTIKKNGTEVSLMIGDEVVKTFYAGGNDAKTQGYFLDPLTDKVYVVSIPGYRVYVSGIFELDESGFRDKYVFRLNWRNFKKLEAEFPAEPKSNFTMLMKDRVVEIVGMPQADTSKINTFLNDVSLLTVEDYQPLDRDTIDNPPIMRITIEDLGSRIYELVLYRKEQDTFPGKVNGEGTIFTSRAIQPILRKKPFFAK